MEYTPLLERNMSSFLWRPRGTPLSSYAVLMGSMLGAGILTLPNTVVLATVVPSVLLLLANAALTGLSFVCLALVAESSESYSYEAIGSLFFSRLEMTFLRIVTLVPLFGGAVMYIVIAIDMLSSFIPMSRHAIAFIFILCAFPLCVPDTLYSLRHASSMVVFCVLYVVAVLVYHAVGLPWPSNSQSITLEGLALTVPIQTLSFCCHFNFVRAYGELFNKKKIAPIAASTLASGLVLYITASLAGYVCLHGSPPADILTGFALSDISFTTVKLALGISMWCKTPMVFQPFREIIEIWYMRPNIEHLRLTYRVSLILTKMSDRRLLLPRMSERRTRFQNDASFLTLAASALGVGVLVLPSTIAKASLFPSLVALSSVAIAAFASLHSLGVVATATQASSYEAISKRLCSARHAQLIRGVTLLPLAGSIVIYLLVVMELMSPFVPLERPALCAIFCSLVFPLCLPDIVPHFLHWTRLMILLCALHLTCNLFIYSTTNPWPEKEEELTRIDWIDISYIVPVHLSSFLYNLQLLKSHLYGSYGIWICPTSNILSSFPTSDYSIDIVRIFFSLTLLLTIPRAYFPLRRAIEDSYFAERKSVGRLFFRILATLLFFLVVGCFAIANVDLSQTLFWFGATVGSAVMLIIPGYFLFQVTQGPAFALPGIALYKLLALLLMVLGGLVTFEKPLEAKGTFWTSTFALVGTMMGAGALALPSTMSQTNIASCIVIFFIMAIYSFVSCSACVVTADATGQYSYEEMSAVLFGRGRQWFVRLLTLILLFGIIAMFMVVSMDLLHPFVEAYVSRTTIGLIFTFVAIPLCLADSLYALRYSNSIVVGCMMYIFVVLFIRAIQDGGLPKEQPPVTLHGVLYTIPLQALSFGCQINSIRVYGELKHKSQMHGVNFATMFFGLIVYVLFTLFGYICFHGNASADILTGFSTNDPLVNSVRMVLGTCIVLKIPLIFQPFVQVLQIVTVGVENGGVSQTTKYITTIGSLFAAYVVAITCKDLSMIMGLVGAIGDILINFAVPGMFIWQVGINQMNEKLKWGGIFLTLSGMAMCIVSLIGMM
ncbi:Amino Acid/Auxin Permease (AAAP) Family [Thraustotheca clavata]|uniref:Amino Acid/Auxin Permease (AAAP) Family n=1 Tax=Thraustotheca clavata TaxID=74557 RepID=A0A1W0AAF4_9STRA|nr:Amino Acid/Auxin Permease (AAAP) Family [Thraustotheca clavata]